MIAAVRRAGVILVAVGVCASVALAANGDPQKKLTAAGQARARQASLRPADLPGWKATPHKPASDENDPRCSYYNPDQSDLVEVGDYDSPDFDRPDGSSVSVSTGVFRTVQMAKTAYARVAQPALPKCFAELFRKGAGGSRTTVFSSRRLEFPRYGDRSDAYRIVAAVKAPNATVRVYIDIFLLNKGAVDVAVLALGIARPLPAGLERSLAARLAARAA
jgi:hypothetical protein